MDMIDEFIFVPWGNSYYEIESCPSTATYSHPARICWNLACNATSHANNDPNCFQGKQICQFGEPDCYANRLEACALKHYNPTQSLSFINCYEGLNVPSNKAAVSCARQANMNVTLLQDCSSGVEGKTLDSSNARLTAMIPGGHAITPYPILNGVVLNRNASLLEAICTAYNAGTGVTPPACK